MPATPYLLHVTRQGSGPVLVLVHGLVGSARIWEPVVAQLAKHFDVVRIDLLGYGRSPKPRLNYSPAVHVTAIHDTLRAEGIEAPFVMAGLSMGVPLVLEYARRWPADVRKILGIGLPYYQNPTEAKTFLRNKFWTRTALERPLLGYTLAAGGMLLAKGGKRFVRGFSKLYTPEMVQESLNGSYHAFRTGMAACLIENRLEPLLIKTQFIEQHYLQGGQDRWTRQVSVDAVLRGQQNCYLTVLPGAPHNTVVSEPRQTADWMIGAIRG